MEHGFGDKVGFVLNDLYVDFQKLFDARFVWIDLTNHCADIYLLHEEEIWRYTWICTSLCSAQSPRQVSLFVRFPGAQNKEGTESSIQSP